MSVFRSHTFACTSLFFCCRPVVLVLSSSFFLHFLCIFSPFSHMNLTLFSQQEALRGAALCGQLRRGRHTAPRRRQGPAVGASRQLPAAALDLRPLSAHTATRTRFARCARLRAQNGRRVGGAACADACTDSVAAAAGDDDQGVQDATTACRARATYGGARPGHG